MVTLIGTAGFAVYGTATHAPSTVSYVFVVTALAALVVWLRPPQLSPRLAGALSVLAIAHLAGGLVRVGDDVLYNAYIGSRLFEYDHLVHSSAVCVGTIVLWTCFGPAMKTVSPRRSLI